MYLVLKHKKYLMSVLKYIFLIYLVLKYFESIHLMPIFDDTVYWCIIDWCITWRYKESLFYWLWFRQETGDTVCRAKLFMAILQDWVPYRQNFHIFKNTYHSFFLFYGFFDRKMTGMGEASYLLILLITKCEFYGCGNKD